MRITSKSKSKPKVLLLAPHPDDIEFFATDFCMQAVKANFEVHELCSCCDEYGTSDKNFKGHRIRRIRRHEMITSAKIYGVDENGDSLIKLHWANYIDGHVPFNEKSIARFQKFILKINPDIILGPDPFVFFDGHTDHKATGRNYYCALERMKPEQRPRKMFYFQSLMPNYFIPAFYEKIGWDAYNAHKSQASFFVDIFRKIKPILWFKYSIMHRGLGKKEAYRKVTFVEKENEPHGLTKWLFKLLFEKGGWGDQDPDLFVPTPKDFGFDLEPKEDIK